MTMRAFLLIALLSVCSGMLFAQSTSPSAPIQKGATMHAEGTFDVTIKPEASEEKTEGPPLGRMSIDKQYHGAIEGTGKGEMLTAGTGAGSGAYVALERVTGTLNGRRGTFVLHHRGIMTRGTPDLTISVVPDSGTGQLAGLTGQMTIKIKEGRHSYDFEYSLPDKP